MPADAKKGQFEKVIFLSLLTLLLEEIGHETGTL